MIPKIRLQKPCSCLSSFWNLLLLREEGWASLLEDETTPNWVFLRLPTCNWADSRLQSPKWPQEIPTGKNKQKTAEMNPDHSADTRNCDQIKWLLFKSFSLGMIFKVANNAWYTVVHIHARTQRVGLGIWVCTKSTVDIMQKDLLGAFTLESLGKLLKNLCLKKHAVKIRVSFTLPAHPLN